MQGSNWTAMLSHTMTPGAENPEENTQSAQLLFSDNTVGSAGGDDRRCQTYMNTKLRLANCRPHSLTLGLPGGFLSVIL